jgi:hypothetical protein
MCERCKDMTTNELHREWVREVVVVTLVVLGVLLMAIAFAYWYFKA